MTHWKQIHLQNGKTFITSEKGNSMTPLLRSGQEHELTPVDDWYRLEPGDIVFCKVRGSYYTHKVLAVNSVKGCQIGNNKGHVNGWTTQVYGKVTQIL